MSAGPDGRSDAASGQPEGQFYSSSDLIARWRLQSRRKDWSRPQHAYLVATARLQVRALRDFREICSPTGSRRLRGWAKVWFPLGMGCGRFGPRGGERWCSCRCLVTGDLWAAAVFVAPYGCETTAREAQPFRLKQETVERKSR